jgi:hypothetical protein
MQVPPILCVPISMAILHLVRMLAVQVGDDVVLIKGLYSDFLAKGTASHGGGDGSDDAGPIGAIGSGSAAVLEKLRACEPCRVQVQLPFSAKFVHVCSFAVSAGFSCPGA